MLPPERRLRAAGDFRAVFAAGVRAGSRTVVVHLKATPEPPGVTRVGFVVSKAVGNAVVRNRVKRRLRHATRNLEVPGGADVVVRALPAAAIETSRLLPDLETSWRRACNKAAKC